MAKVFGEYYSNGNIYMFPNLQGVKKYETRMPTLQR